MMTVEIRVNGSIVAALCAIKIDNHYDAKKNYHIGTYEYQGASFPIDNQGPCATVNGKLTHLISEGVEVLAAKLCTLAARSLGHPISITHHTAESDHATDHGATRGPAENADDQS